MNDQDRAECAIKAAEYQAAKTNLLAIVTIIKTLPAAEQEAVKELAEHFRAQMKTAGSPVGEAALSLVGAELQCTLNG